MLCRYNKIIFSIITIKLFLWLSSIFINSLLYNAGNIKYFKGYNDKYFKEVEVAKTKFIDSLVDADKTIDEVRNVFKDRELIVGVQDSIFLDGIFAQKVYGTSEGYSPSNPVFIESVEGNNIYLITAGETGVKYLEIDQLRRLGDRTGSDHRRV